MIWQSGTIWEAADWIRWRFPASSLLGDGESVSRLDGMQDKEYLNSGSMEPIQEGDPQICSIAYLLNDGW